MLTLDGKLASVDMLKVGKRHTLCAEWTWNRCELLLNMLTLSFFILYSTFILNYPTYLIYRLLELDQLS